MNRIDTFRHKGMRQQMVDNLRSKGIKDERVLNAMNEVPRHWFIDSALDTMAYEDRAIRIGCEQTISHPSTVAMQSQLLQVQPGTVREANSSSSLSRREKSCFICFLLIHRAFAQSASSEALRQSFAPAMSAPFT